MPKIVNESLFTIHTTAVGLSMFASGGLYSDHHPFFLNNCLFWTC
jgi:hypothetical protein